MSSEHNNNAGFQKWQVPSMSPKSAKVVRHEPDKAEEVPEPAPEIPTAEEIENWHKQAQEEGHKQGYDEGYQQGLQQALQESEDHKQRLSELLEFLEAPLQSLNEEVEQQLTLLAVTLAQQLVKREIRAEPGEIIGVIRESVQLLPATSRRIRIILNPEDAELVRNTLQLDEHEDGPSWKLIEDPMISRGGCEIKSDQSVINATLENRLQALAASVLGGDRMEDQDVADAD